MDVLIKAIQTEVEEAFRVRFESIGVCFVAIHSLRGVLIELTCDYCFGPVGNPEEDLAYGCSRCGEQTCRPNAQPWMEPRHSSRGYTFAGLARWLEDMAGEGRRPLEPLAATVFASDALTTFELLLGAKLIRDGYDNWAELRSHAAAVQSSVNMC